MKRGIICIVILSVMLTLSITELFYLKSGVKKITADVNTIIALSQSDSTDSVNTAIDSLKAHWQSLYRHCAFFIQTQKLEETNLAISRLEVMYENENDEFFSELEVIKASLEKIYINELPRVENVA